MTVDAMNTSEISRMAAQSGQRPLHDPHSTATTQAGTSATPASSSHPAAAQDAKTTNDANTPPKGALQFWMDNQTNQLVVQIVNGDSKEVIRKMPAEEISSFVEATGQSTGLLIKTKA